MFVTRLTTSIFVLLASLAAVADARPHDVDLPPQDPSPKPVSECGYTVPLSNGK